MHLFFLLRRKAEAVLNLNSGLFRCRFQLSLPTVLGRHTQIVQPRLRYKCINALHYNKIISTINLKEDPSVDLSRFSSMSSTNDERRHRLISRQCRELLEEKRGDTVAATQKWLTRSRDWPARSTRQRAAALPHDSAERCASGADSIRNLSILYTLLSTIC